MNDDSSDLLYDCQSAVTDLNCLAQSLMRSVQCASREGTIEYPDKALVEEIAKRIRDLDQQISDRI